MSNLKPRPTRRTRAKHGGDKKTIEARLLAAIDHCLEGGGQFGNLTIEQITSEAGMSRATFYDHFTGMGDLVTRLMIIVTEEIIQDAGAWLAFAAKPTRKDFEAAMRGMSATFRRHRAVIAAFHVTALLDPAVEAHYDAMVGRVCERCRHALNAARGEGSVRTEAEDDVADSIAWIIVMYFSRFALTKEDADFERFTRSLTHICSAAVFRDSSESSASAE